MLSLMLGREEWRELRSGTRAFVAAVADMLVPPSCPSCAAPLNGTSGLCIVCWGDLRFIEEPCCRRSGQPFPEGSGLDRVHPLALGDPPPWTQARAAVAFDGTARRLVHRLKYADRQEAARVMARLMRRAGAGLIAEADFILPVPLHRARLWRRRFNQAALLALALDPARTRSDVVRRVRATARQVGLDAAARRRNLTDAFAVPETHRALIQGKRLLLVDDVLTTGATLGSVSRTLLAAGAGRVDVLVFALVLAGEEPHISGE